MPSHTPPHKRPAAPPPPPLPPAKEDTTGCFILAGILGVIVLVILCIKWPWLLVVASTLVTATLLYFAIRPAVRILKKHRSIILLTVSFGGMLAYYIYRLSCFMANTLNERTVEMKIGFSLAILWAVWLAALLFRRFVRP